MKGFLIGVVAFIALVLFVGIRYDYKLVEARNIVHDRVAAMVTAK